MPKFIVTPRVHIEDGAATEIIEADTVAPLDGWVVFIDANRNPVVMLNKDDVKRVEVSTIA